MEEDFYEAQRVQFEGIERSFVFAGVEFGIKPVLPADVEADLIHLNSEKFDENAFDFGVHMIRRTLRPEFRARWDALLVEEREQPITLKMIYSVIGQIAKNNQSLVEAETGRPTQPPSPSGNTGGSISTKSTDDSDSPEPAKASAPFRSVPV